MDYTFLVAFFLELIFLQPEFVALHHLIPSKFYRQATIGLLFTKMSKDTSASVTDVRGWGNRLQGMKCLSNLK